jgi:crotonobetainyl-CoA:carnitine CoA-transferase CaiB-like acyl-CoA transferase
MDKLNAAKVSCGPINDMADIEADVQLASRDMFVTLDHPVMGSVRVVGSPLKLSETPVSYRRAPPLAGEHTEEILLQRLKLSRGEIEKLREANVI